MITKEHDVDQTAGGTIKFLRKTLKHDGCYSHCSGGRTPLSNRHMTLAAAKNNPVAKKKCFLSNSIPSSKLQELLIQASSHAISFVKMIPVADRSDQVSFSYFGVILGILDKENVEKIIEETPPEERVRTVLFFAQARVDHEIDVEWLAGRMLEIPVPGSASSGAASVVLPYSQERKLVFIKYLFFLMNLKVESPRLWKLPTYISKMLILEASEILGNLLIFANTYWKYQKNNVSR